MTTNCKGKAHTYFVVRQCGSDDFAYDLIEELFASESLAVSDRNAVENSNFV